MRSHPNVGYVRLEGLLTVGANGHREAPGRDKFTRPLRMAQASWDNGRLNVRAMVGSDGEVKMDVARILLLGTLVNEPSAGAADPLRGHH